MTENYLLLSLIAVGNTLVVYLPAWVIGTISGVVVSFLTWCVPKKLSTKIYWVLSGASFIPVTILIPFFIRTFGLQCFIYPLLVMPVALITFASSYEAFKHANKHRITLIINYKMPRFKYFWTIVFRESMPSMKTTFRQTLSLCFAICIALDYFIEYWGGLGALAMKYYSSFDNTGPAYLLITILITAILGIIQVIINDRMFRKWTEFRRHY